MGMSLDFYNSDGSDADAPQEYSERYRGRHEWYGLIGSSLVEAEHRCFCNCGDGEHVYGCDGPFGCRPKDFPQFRAVLDREFWPKFPGQEIFRELTDWLEAHPGVFVGIS